MKLIKKIKDEVTIAYDAWFNSYINGDVKTYDSYLDDAYHFIGSTNNEEFLNRKDTTIFFKATADQLAGKTDIKNKTRIIEIFDGLVFITEIFDAYFLMESEWAYYGKFRFTSVLQKKSEGWRFIYQHFSMPDSKAQEGETLGGEQVSKENQELRDAIKRRTAELEIKNRELEIETSLERVRAQAMAMHQPDDLLNICKTLYKEFNTLGFGEMRNTMINIHNDADKSFINYDYSDEIGKSTNYLTYTIHPLVEKQIKKIRSAKDAFSETYFEGKDLTEWKKFRKKIGEKTDSRLATTKGLYYYFYSIGIGSIGISTFGPISSEKKILLKRFRNVFNLSYQRYIDIANAEAQAKEARIETALERVRAIAMAMRKPEDLASIGETLFTELKALHFADLRNTEMIINNDSNETIKSYYYSDYGITGIIEMSYKTNPVLQKWIDDLKKADDAFAEVIIPKNEMKAWIQFRESIGYLPDPKLNKATSVYYYSYSIGLGALSISSFQAISEAQIKILERFRNVFNLSYQRYSDIAQAKLQAREAEIELALERVRARTMAMQHSDELQDAAIILFQQLKNLGIETGSCGFNIWDENEKTATVWMSSPDGGLQIPFTLPHTESKIYKAVFKAKENKEDFKVIEVKGKALINHFDYLLTLPGIGDVIKKLRESHYVFPEKMIYHFAFFNNGYLTFHTHESVTEAHAIFKRFAKVFEQTYTRFIDLQKAEASAKEAQIEAALEKVRSRSLAMHKAEELGEVVTVIVEKMRELNLPVDDGVALVTHIEGSKNQIEWLENPGFPSAIKFYQTYFDHPILSDYWKAKMEGLDFIAPRYTAEESRSFLNHIFQFSDYKHTPQEIKDYCLAANTYSYSAAFQKNSSIFINDYSGRSLSEQEINLVIRFSKVFEQTYTRFLDLQKAEAQAREAQIEAALEKVRSHSMGMQKSEELKDVIKIVYQQLTSLKINLDHAGFVVDYKPKDDWHFWIADEQDIPSKITHPYFDSVWANQFNAAKKNGADFFATNLNFEEKNKFYNALLSYVPDIPQASKDFYLTCPGLAATTVLFDNVSLYMENFSGTPYSDEENKILMRFGKVFQQTYTRFLDLQKAEAQTREAQIEAALERVRSRSMAMHNSNEIGDVAFVLFQQLKSLGGEFWGTGFVFCKQDSKVDEVWFANENGIMPHLKIPNTIDPAHKQMYQGWKKNLESFSIAKDGKELKDHYKYMLTVPDVQPIFQGMLDNGITFPKWQKWNAAYFKYGYLLAITAEPYENEGIFVRFAKVFDQAYIRFLDLQKAEASAREAQINLAVERVRAKALAMFKSEEILEMVFKLKEEIMNLNIPGVAAATIHLKEKNGKHRMWDLSSIEQDGQSMHLPLDVVYNLDETDPKFYIRKIWGNTQQYFLVKQDRKDLKITTNWLRANGKNKEADEADAFLDSIQFNYLYHPTIQLNNGRMSIDLLDVAPPQEIEFILTKMGAAFDLAYKRFEDLKNSEAQLREAQIEAALEKVRTVALTLKKSDELLDIAEVLYNQLFVLGFSKIRNSIIDIHNEKKETFLDYDYSPDMGKSVTLMSYYDHPIIEKQVQQMKSSSDAFFELILEGQDLQDLIDLRIKNGEEEDIRLNTIEQLTYNFYSFGDGGIGLSNFGILTEEQKLLLKRFRNVFAFAYKRYKDLAQAEAQAREAQIEMALEKIRSRTMAMQHSDELPEAANLLFLEVQALGIPAWSCGYNVLAVDKKTSDCWMSSEGAIQEPFNLYFTEETSFIEWYNFIKSDENFFIQELAGDALVHHYNYMRNIPKLGDVIKKLEDAGINLPTYQINHLCKYLNGFLLFITYESVPEAHEIFKRFTKVFEQTYTRFLDLQKAEAQSREAQIETALERVRSRTLAMQNSDELAETSVVLFKQLIDLGIAPNRLYIGIITDDSGVIEFWATDEDGTKISSKFTGNKNHNKSVKKMYDNWATNKKSITIDMHGKELVDYLHYLGDVLHVPFKQGHSQNRRVQTIAYFSKGFIGIASPEEQPEETTKLLERFAAVFNLTFTRFNDLKIAEAHAIQAEQDLIEIKAAKQSAETALSNLQSTQKQLIQSEKMASLGELTAGIAHEIQNPLNFVNNFSEVSKELLDELKEELEKGNLEEAKEIMNHVIQNLEKINHHGKRADGIVKGMLQHSRSSTATKEPTDVNKLADEYLRLAYHGLRAKDKSFNATMKTDFDLTIEKINIIPQDIGRVILNLITNAFYVVNEKKKDMHEEYEPTVIVSTKNINNNILISVIDNGNGIPQNILDKIFQPFFTTKPTGQGTGLGLSLSYDIITKGHGGELKVETKEGEGSVFIILLPVV